MIITLLSLRQKKTDPFEAIAAEYAMKIQRWRLVRHDILHRGASDKVTTSASLSSKVPPGALLFVLDERGEDLSSLQFADVLASLEDQSVKNLAILIGGPLGLDASLRQSADKVIGFGRCTWPHKMVYVMVLEQIYRAQQILTNHPYHKP